MVFRRLSFERGFAPLCRLKGVGSAKSAVGSLKKILGIGAGLCPVLLVYWCIGYWESRFAALLTVPRSYGPTVLESHGLTFLLPTSCFKRV